MVSRDFPRPLSGVDFLFGAVLKRVSAEHRPIPADEQRPERANAGETWEVSASSAFRDRFEAAAAMDGEGGVGPNERSTGSASE